MQQKNGNAKALPVPPAHKNDKRHQDSVTLLRQHSIDSMRDARKIGLDKMRATQKKNADSIVSIRKATTDVLKAKQQKRTDSLALIRKYRQSKRYQDSVSLARSVHADSVHTARQIFTDSVLAARKKQMDALKVIRKHYTDSVVAIQKKRLDSLKAIQKVRADSLAKIKAEKDKKLKEQEKKRMAKFDFALQIKIKKKHEEYSNEQLLTKKWSLPRQGIQNMFTRYNYYYNADKRMNEAIANMQRLKKDNFDSLIALYPFDPNRDSLTLAADMDSIIQKASVGIQIHDPRTKWGDDLYLLLGEAFYYKGDYKNALAAFRYVVSLQHLYDKEKGKKVATTAKKSDKSKEPSIVEPEDKGMLEFLHHRKVHNDAILWMARTYTEQHQLENTESVLELVENDPAFPDNLKGRLALEKGFLAMSRQNYTDAASQFTIAMKDDNIPEWMRRRTAYINGQLLQQQGKYQISADCFTKVLDMNPKIDMDFYARKSMATSLMMAGMGQDDATASLKKMLNDGKYLPYYEQVYYVLGCLSASANHIEAAIKYYNKGIAMPKATKKQKALSFAALGNTYYSVGRYREAKQAYDSASFLSTFAGKDSSVILAMHRSRALNEIATPANLINAQDSMLALALLSTKEQKAAARNAK